MNCDQFENDVVTYFFGSMSPQQMDLVDRHLIDCPKCLRSLLRLKRDIQWHDGAHASQQTRTKIRLNALRELEKINPLPSQLRRWERSAAFFAAGIALIIGIAVTRELTNGPGRAPSSLVITQISKGVP